MHYSCNIGQPVYYQPCLLIKFNRLCNQLSIILAQLQLSGEDKLQKQFTNGCSYSTNLQPLQSSIIRLVVFNNAILRYQKGLVGDLQFIIIEAACITLPTLLYQLLYGVLKYASQSLASLCHNRNYSLIRKISHIHALA